jgi:hypothetical protein
LLDLPPRLSGVVSIPDSVEVLSFYGSVGVISERTLVFGRDSRLREIHVKSNVRPTPYRSFLQFAARSLKIFRTNMELEQDL